MARYMLRKAGHYVVLLFIAVSFTYVLAGSQLQPQENYRRQLEASPEAREAILRTLDDYNLNTDESVVVRYGRWLNDLAFGEAGSWNRPLTGEWPRWNAPFAWLAWQPLQDWGVSPRGAPVSEEVSVRMWVSLRLVTVGTVAGVALGVLLGAWTATRQYGRIDKVATVSSLVIISIPAFVLAIVLILLGIRFNNATGTSVFRTLGETGRHGDRFFDPFLNRVQHLVLPTITLALTQIAIYSRLQRNLMLDNLGADYVRTAQAKGLRRRQAVFKHALRTSLIPTATYFAFTIGLLFTGSVFVERIFGWHGMGNYAVETIVQQDIHGAVAAASFAGVLVVIAAILSELFVALLDPRVRVR